MIDREPTTVVPIARSAPLTDVPAAEAGGSDVPQGPGPLEQPTLDQADPGPGESALAAQVLRLSAWTHGMDRRQDELESELLGLKVQIGALAFLLGVAFAAGWLYLRAGEGAAE